MDATAEPTTPLPVTHVFRATETGTDDISHSTPGHALRRMCTALRLLCGDADEEIAEQALDYCDRTQTGLLAYDARLARNILILVCETV